jgi:hypothetical protein
MRNLGLKNGGGLAKIETGPFIAWGIRLLRSVYGFWLILSFPLKVEKD